MKNIIEVLKNWWFAVIGVILIVLDQGFEVIKPLLVDAGLDGKYMGLIRLAFGVYGIIKLQKSWPTNNPEKVKAFAEDIGLPKPKEKKNI